MMAYEEHSNAVHAYRLWLLHGLSPVEVDRRFKLSESKKHNRRFDPEQYKEHGSQNFEKLPKIVLGDFAYYRALTRMYRAHGLHSKEISPIYHDHAVAWYHAATLWMDEDIIDVVRSTLAVFALCSVRGPHSKGIVRTRDHTDHPQKGSAVFQSGGLSTAFPGQRAMNHSQVKAGNVTNHYAWQDFLALELGYKLKLNPSEIKPYLLYPPSRSGLCEMSDGSMQFFNKVRIGTWWLDAWKMGTVVPVLTQDEAKVLRSVIEGSQKAASEAVKMIRFPYQGEITMCRTGSQGVYAYNHRPLNSNKPPIDYAHLKDGRMTMLCTGGDPKRNNWGVRSPGAKAVEYDEGTIRFYWDDSDEYFVGPVPVTPMYKVHWWQNGIELDGNLITTPHGEVPELEEDIDPPEEIAPLTRDGWLVRIWERIKALF